MPPLTLLIKPVSGLCQMRCAYCFYADEMRRRGDGVYAPMTLDTLEILVRKAFAYADDRVHFAFQGGEPTLAGADFYRALLRFEKKYNARGLSVTHAIQTNGFSVDDGLLSVLREGRFLCGLSVDGTRELHDTLRTDAAGNGTWEKAIDTASRFRAAGIPFNILCVVDGRVASRPEAVMDALSGFPYLQFIPRLDPPGGSTDPYSLDGMSYGKFLVSVYRRYSALLRQNRFISVRNLDNYLMLLSGRPADSCAFMGQCAPNLVVESDGRIYPCDFYALDEWCMGNIRTSSFYKLAKAPVQQSFLTPDPVPDACRACAYYPLCRNGCRRERVDGKTFLCEGMKFFFDTCLADMRQLLASGVTERVAPPDGL